MVSVVIPIYNVSQYIDRGLGYILAQDYSSFEVLLVDDGSTDGSSELCDEWAQKDSRIRVLHKENAGAGSARNVGIDNAIGEYIYFFDIDDRIPTHLLTSLVTQIEEAQAEMLVFGYNNIDVKYKTTTTVTFPHKLLDSNEALRDSFVDEFVLKVNGFPWNKMYRKSFLDKFGLRFEDQRIQQDEVFNLKCYRYVSRLLLSDCVLYDYFVYDKGNTRSRFIPDRLYIYISVFEHFLALKKNWSLDDERLDNYLYKRFGDSLIQCCVFNLFHPDCKWSRMEKKVELNKLVNNRYSISTFKFYQSNNTNIEKRLYLYALKRESLLLLYFIHSFFDRIRRIKHLI